MNFIEQILEQLHQNPNQPMVTEMIGAHPKESTGHEVLSLCAVESPEHPRHTIRRPSCTHCTQFGVLGRSRPCHFGGRGHRGTDVCKTRWERTRGDDARLYADACDCIQCTHCRKNSRTLARCADHIAGHAI